MQRRSCELLLTAAVLAMAMTPAGGCGKDSPTRPEAGSVDGGTPSSATRIAWVQPAGSLSEASSYSYVLYVDDVRTLLANAVCQAGATAGVYDCTAALPALSSGRHVLHVAATNASGEEGPRSEAISITIGS